MPENEYMLTNTDIEVQTTLVHFKLFNPSRALGSPRHSAFFTSIMSTVYFDWSVVWTISFFSLGKSTYLDQAFH